MARSARPGIFTGLAWRWRRHRNRRGIRVPASAVAARLGIAAPVLAPQSLVIPAVGSDYVEEGTLAAQFAGRFCRELEEIVLVSDQPAGAFAGLPAKARVATLDVTALLPRAHAYSAIYKSRLVKILAPLQARHQRIVVTDSDLVILRPFALPFADGCVMGSFRRGKMIGKVRDADAAVPSELAGTFRPYLWDHLNGAFLAATRATWEKLSPAWLANFIGIWSKLPDSQPPTDQLPLCCSLDHLGLATIDLGDWINWPVSKRIGGTTASVPPEVIGAHGGFPLSEWRRYLEDPGCALSFVGQAETRKARYLKDSNK
jgi:hypothetical protein